MKIFNFILGSILLISIFEFSNASKVCYEAKTCIHNANEKCGVDSSGQYRRFYDTCDMLEYNCLKTTAFVKTDPNNCNSLPPIEDKKEGKEDKTNTENVES